VSIPTPQLTDDEDEKKNTERTTAVWQNGGLSRIFNGSSSIKLLCKTEHLDFDFRHFAKLQTVVRHYIIRQRTKIKH
jgi:hypothetical protein